MATTMLIAPTNSRSPWRMDAVKTNHGKKCDNTRIFDMYVWERVCEYLTYEYVIVDTHILCVGVCEYLTYIPNFNPVLTCIALLCCIALHQLSGVYWHTYALLALPTTPVTACWMETWASTCAARDTSTARAFNLDKWGNRIVHNFVFV